MIINPVYKKESAITWKSLRLVLILSMFNLFLAIYMVSRVNAEIRNMIVLLEVNYRGIPAIFKSVVSISYAVALLVSSAISASGISSEIERRSLDIMLSTVLTPADIVLGKFMTCFFNILIYLGTGIPIFSFIFMYGGVSFMDFFMIILAYVMGAYLVICMGLFCSALLQKTGVANFFSYMLLLVVFVLSLALPKGIETLLDINIDFSSMGNGMVRNVLLLNPLSTFYMSITRISKNGVFWTSLFSPVEVITDTANADLYFFSGIFAQFLVGGVFLYMAIRKISPKVDQ